MSAEAALPAQEEAHFSGGREPVAAGHHDVGLRDRLPGGGELERRVVQGDPGLRVLGDSDHDVPAERRRGVEVVVDSPGGNAVAGA